MHCLASYTIELQGHKHLIQNDCSEASLQSQHMAGLILVRPQLQQGLHACRGKSLSGCQAAAEPVLVQHLLQDPFSIICNGTPGMSGCC